MRPSPSAHRNALSHLIGAAIDSRDIVDRHRERTLALLWKIVFAFQVLFNRLFCLFLTRYKWGGVETPVVQCICCL